jgi:hypothetical protein
MDGAGTEIFVSLSVARIPWSAAERRGRMAALRTEDNVEEYNRDGPQQGTPSWMGIIFSMVAGFLLGGSSCLVLQS